MFAIFLSLIVATSASLMRYPNYNQAPYNSPTFNYAHYSKPTGNNPMNYPVPSLIRPQPPISKGPLCGILNGAWKTFSNIQEFKEEIRQGYGWIFYSYGHCPGQQNPESNSDQPICAIYNSKLRTFSNHVAVEVENILTGENWVKLYCGECSITAAPITTTTVAPIITTPSPSSKKGAVCGVLNGVWKTFSNIKELKAAKNYGWSFYGNGRCPRPEICAKFNDEFKTFPNALALEVENYMTGKNWIIEFSGQCPTTTLTASTSTTTSTTTTPNPPISVTETKATEIEIGSTTTPSSPITSTSPNTPSSPIPLSSVDDTYESIVDTTKTTTTTSSTEIQPSSVDDTFEIIKDTTVGSTTTTTTTTTTSSTTREPTPTSTSMPPISIDDTSDSVTPISSTLDGFMITTPKPKPTYTTYHRTPSSRRTNISSGTNRIQQNNSFHGPYVEGSYNYYPNFFNKNNTRAYYDLLF